MSTPINYGGPAFPCMVFSGDANNYPEYANGMTLRDWFAGQVACGMAANPDTHCTNAVFSHVAYGVADAMLAERAKGGAA